MARTVSPGSLARVDAVSLARPEAITPTRTAGALVPGDPFPAVTTAQDWTAGRPAAPQPVIRLTLANVGSLGIDLVRAGIARGHAASLPVATDGLTRLTLLGAKPGATVTLDGHRAGRVGAAGTFTLAVPAGSHTVAVG